ncbi:MAG: CHAT domain-containing protein [Chloroflexi bacterium]|nr:CHAT domain-containing protein [Chloroflexota bacterium]
MSSPLHAAARDVAAGTRTLDDALASLAREPLAPADLIAAAQDAEPLAVHAPREGMALARLAAALARSAGEREADAACALQLTIVANFTSHLIEAVGAARHVLELTGSDASDTGRAHRFRARLELARALRLVAEPPDAEAVLTEAQADAPAFDMLLMAHMEFVRGLIAARSNRHANALEHYESAAKLFGRGGSELDVARCWRSAAELYNYSRADQTLTLLDQAQAVFNRHDASLDRALNDYVRGMALWALDQHGPALALQICSWRQLTDLDAPYHAAAAQSEAAVPIFSLNRYAEAEMLMRDARAHYAQVGAAGDMARCDINLAALYNETNRPREALPLLQSALVHAQSTGRLYRAAICQGGLAFTYRHLGQYDRALQYSLLARPVFVQADMLKVAAELDEDLAGTYQRLGMDAAAEAAYRSAVAYYDANDQHASRARLLWRLAEFRLAQHVPDAAEALLRGARAICVEQQMDTFTGECDRLLAEAAMQRGDLAGAAAHMRDARATFAAQNLPFHTALCDRLDGELQLARGDLPSAMARLDRARQVLEPVSPAETWRVRVALGECAVRSGDPGSALDHWRAAIRLAAAMRAPLPTERIASAFFAAHGGLITPALQLAIQRRQFTAALEIAEAAKTTTFARFLAQRERPKDTNAQDGEARRLRGELTALQAQLDLAAKRDGKPTTEPQVMERLQQLAHAYDQQVEQDRVLSAGDLNAEPFDLAVLRERLSRTTGARWHCLVYHLDGDQLACLSLMPDQLTAGLRTLSRLDAALLRDCTSTEPDLRERIYRHTLGGWPLGAQLPDGYLRQLHDWLIPPDVRDLDPDGTLFIIPSGALHNLPFQALLDGETRLIERAPIVYAPSLQALQTMLNRAAPARGRALLCGLSDYGERAPALNHTRSEIDAIAGIVGAEARVLWGPDATPEALRQMSAEGTLAGMTAIHIAAHAVPGRIAPVQARIRLHGDDLSATDILDLRLGPAVVTLSACQGAVGELLPGDELSSLARMFFYAGARALVASQWPVEDAPTMRLMTAFYGELRAGASPARALQRAQIALLRAGLPPYHWAAFNVFGTG